MQNNKSTKGQSQHYVPRFYLRNFSADRNFLYSYKIDKDYGKDSIEYKSANNLCCEKDLYEIPGVDNNFIECWFSQYENDLAKGFRKAVRAVKLRNKALLSESIPDFYIFSILQLCRGRGYREFCKMANCEKFFPYLAITKGSDFILRLVENYVVERVVCFLGNDFWVTDDPVTLIPSDLNWSNINISFPLCTFCSIGMTLRRGSAGGGLIDIEFDSSTEKSYKYFNNQIIGRSYGSDTMYIMKETNFSPSDLFYIQQTVKQLTPHK